LSCHFRIEVKLVTIVQKWDFYKVRKVSLFARRRRRRRGGQKSKFRTQWSTSFLYIRSSIMTKCRLRYHSVLSNFDPTQRQSTLDCRYIYTQFIYSNHNVYTIVIALCSKLLLDTLLTLLCDNLKKRMFLQNFFV
jgi:hypothetical protein